MKTLSLYIGALAFLLGVSLHAQASPEAEFRKLSKHYTLRADGSQELRVQKELTLYTHAAMNSLYGETFIMYDPQYQELRIHESYTRQKDGTVIKTPENAFVEVLPSAAADAPAYNRLKEMVVVHTGLELGATICLDYSIVSRPGYLPALDVYCPVRELSPIKEFSCIIETEGDVPLHTELLNASAMPERTKTENGQRVEWALKNVAPRPYAYPMQGGHVGMVQQVASGMMPVVIASTYPSYTDALKSLRKQFVAGDESVVRAKVEELTKDAAGDRQKMRDAIGQYMMQMYSRLATVGVSLQDAGYRLRPASEVLLSGYGTKAEMVNLDVALQRAAGLDAEVVVCSACPSQPDNMGLSGIFSLFAKSGLKSQGVSLQGTDEARLKDYLTVTDLNGNPVTLEEPVRGGTSEYVRKADDKTVRVLPNGYRIVLAEGRNMASALTYAYANNTTIKENILLPAKFDHTYVTTVRLLDGMTWMPKSDKEISNSCGKVVFKYEPGEGEVKVSCTLTVGKQLITPAEYRDFYALMREWKDENNYTLVLR